MAGNWWDDGSVARIRNNKTEPNLNLGVRTIEDLEPMYSVRQVAEYFDVSEGTVYKWKMIGLIEPTMQGRSVKFTAKQIADCKHKRQHQWQKVRKERQLEKVSG